MTRPKLGPLPDKCLGVAVSGGGDSVGLLMLLHHAGFALRAATIDHQLRPESAAEALSVAKLCARYSIPHDILVWETPATTGNLQNEARNARRTLLAAWAQQNGLTDIVLGHTLDDQAETVLMRLARGSGVDGLAGMKAKRMANGLCWHRPMLGLRRAELRTYLRSIDIGWVDDSSNEDMKYDRIKARKALDILAPLGVSSVRLAETAAHMGRARQALETATHDLADGCISITDAGEIQISLPEFFNAPREIQLRLFSAALGWVGNTHYRPRFLALTQLLDACALAEDFGKTLHGCMVQRKKGNILINREVAATPPLANVTSVWDGRWQVETCSHENVKIGALGADGLQSCASWRDTGHRRAALLASPSLWREGLLIAAPMANYGDKWLVNLAGGKKGFYDQLITH